MAGSRRGAAGSDRSASVAGLSTDDGGVGVGFGDGTGSAGGARLEATGDAGGAGGVLEVGTTMGGTSREAAGGGGRGRE